MMCWSAPQWLKAAAACLIANCMVSAAAIGCDGSGPGDGFETLTTKAYAISYRPDPAPIVAGQPFSLDIHTCSLSGGQVEQMTVDASMPEHRHGMNYAPTVSARGDGYYRAEGFLLHMSGRWVLSFEVRGSGAAERAEVELMLP